MTKYSGFEFGPNDYDDQPMDQRRRAGILAASTLNIVVGKLAVVPQFAPYEHPETERAQLLAKEVFSLGYTRAERKKATWIPTNEFPNASVLLPIIVVTAFEVAIEEDGGGYKVYANSYGENVVFRPWSSEMKSVHRLIAQYPGWYYLQARS